MYPEYRFTMLTVILVNTGPVGVNVVTSTPKCLIINTSHTILAEDKQMASKLRNIREKIS